MKLPSILVIVGILSLGLQDGYPQENQEEIEKLIEKLGADDFKTREEATEKLAKMGKKALPYLRKALDNSDAEIRWRAEYIMKEYKNKLIDNVKKYVQKKYPPNYGQQQEPETLDGALIQKHIVGCYFFKFTRVTGFAPMGGQISERVVLGIKDQGGDKPFVVKKLDSIKDFLQPAKTEEDAKEISAVLARLIGLCKNCPDEEISKNIFKVEKRQTGFYAIGEQEHPGGKNYKWEVEFDEQGLVKEFNPPKPPKHKSGR